MTTATRPKAPARVQCPHCGYSAEPGSSIAGHVAMAHPDVPMDTVAPKRPASYVANGEQLADQVSPKRSARNEDEHIPAATESRAASGAATLVEIPLDLVDVGDNVRVTLEAIDELAASIAEHGVLQPVKATLLASGRYRLLWGQRRVLAARKAGLGTIPALVYADEPDDRPIEQLVENLHRADLNPIDRARAMRAVVDAGVSQADLARKLGIAPSTVANDLRLLGLAESVIERIRSGEITASHGKSIASLPPKQQAQLAKSIAERGLSAHALEQELKWRQDEATAEAERTKRTDKHIPKIVAALQAAEVPKGSDVQVGLNSYSFDIDRIDKAIVAGGWKATRGYAPKRSTDCGCTSVRLEVAGSKVVVEPSCSNDAHRETTQKAPRAVDDAARAEYEARLAAIRDEVERVLVAAELPLPLLRMLHAGIVSYGGDIVVTMLDGPKAIAQELVRGWRVREMASPELLAELRAAKP